MNPLYLDVRTSWTFSQGSSSSARLSASLITRCRQTSSSSALLVAQGDATFVAVYIEDLHLDLIAFFNDFPWMADFLCPAQVTDVNQAVHTFFQFHEGTEGGQVANLAGVNRVDRITLFQVIPGIGFELLNTQGDLLVIGINGKYLDLALLSDGKNLGRMLDVL